MSIEQTGQTNVTDNVTTSSAKFELTCHTNINKNIQHQISWFKDDKELLVDGTNFTSYSLNDTQNANSVLVFRNYQNQSAFNYNGDYKCNIYIRYPEVGQGASYQSEPKSVSFSYICNFLFYFQCWISLTYANIRVNFRFASIWNFRGKY